MILVVIHEFGHFWAAKKSGVIVEEFGIGFPPKAWSKKLKSGMIFSINWLPIGGFCRMKGEYDSADKKGSYGKATFWQKTKILFAGVAMNWLAAIVIFTILALTGLPKAFDNQFSIPSDTQAVYSPVTISQIVEGSPAEAAGLQADDELTSINGVQIEKSTQVSELTKQNAGQTVQVGYIRDGKSEETTATLNEASSDKGYLGVATYQSEYIKATWSAPIVGVGTTYQLTVETFKGLGKMAGDFFGGLVKQLSFNAETRESGRESIGEAGNGAAGPIGIIGVIFPQAAQSGATTLLYLAGIISLSLAVMNILPIPALDGGRWLLMAIFKLRRKKLTKETEEKIVSIGFMALMALIVLITVVDITRLF